MYSGFETRWLKGPKWLSPPSIVIASKQYCRNSDGAFVSPRAEIEIDGRCYDASKGIIYISANACDGTLAHEFRHHWQYWCGLKYDGEPFGAQQACSYDDYRVAIVRYFTVSYSESDALLYELKKTPRNNPANAWLDWIREPTARRKTD
jgi:hypothetical protein